MTAPKLEQMKYYIVKPTEQINYIKNPRFDPPDGVEDWATSGAGVTIAVSGDKARRGAYSMKVNPASGVPSAAYYANLSVTINVTYAFSCDVLGVQGQAMRILISDGLNNIKATKQFVATGYWQRVTVSFTSTQTASNYYVAVSRDPIASTVPFYIDGAQFEHWIPTTFFSGYEPGCRWIGAVRNSSSYRPGTLASGGELLCINDYAKVITSYGLGMGDWNQIMTKMTSGGDMYQTHIRKSRNFTLVLAYSGDNQGELQANRKVILDALRPDLAEGQTRIIRYQGFDANGDEATNPIDIHCVFQPSHNDIPDMPMFQKDILNFTIPSGLLQGAYNEGAELDWNAEFPAEFIVKRDKDGNWCEWSGGAYASLITGLNGNVYCMAEGPDGKIYMGGNFTNAGGVAAADYLARWNPITEVWESVISGINGKVNCMQFDANGDLYIGGLFTVIGSVQVNCISKLTNVFTSPLANALGTGVGISSDPGVTSLAVSSSAYVYIAGYISSVGGVANTTNIACWNGTSWSALSTGLNNTVRALTFAPNGDLYIGGIFTDAVHPYLCKWNGTAFSTVGKSTYINGGANALAFDESGNFYIGGIFTNAGGNADADHIAKWNGNQWEPLGTGTNSTVASIVINSGKIYTAGDFTVAGGLTLTDRLAVWSNGAWQPLDIDLPGTASVYAILPASDGSLYIGGAFSTSGSSGVNAKCGVIADSVFALGVASASANTYPYIQVVGPGTLRAITNYTTGKFVMFDGLTLQAGETISLKLDPLDLQFKGAWEGRGNLMRYVVPGSDYGDFYLKPGSNALSLFMTDTNSSSKAWTAWTPLFWGLDGALL